MQWIQFSIITDVITKYYSISTIWVDWTSMIYMILYIFFILPASYLLEKQGLRQFVITGIIGTCMGSGIKLGAVNPKRFWVAFAGQTIVAFSSVFVISVPSKLAAVWFGENEVATACSIGVIGNQFGIALGFLVPLIVVSSSVSTEQLEQQLYYLYGYNAVVTFVVLVLVLVFFKEAPPTPPSTAVARQMSIPSINFTNSLKNLVKNKSYILLLVSYGINGGVFYVISTLLNQIILNHYPTASADAKRIGFLMIVAGFLGSLCFGYILDKIHKYKLITLIIYVFSLLSMIAYTFILSKGIVFVYLISSCLGFFMTALLPIGFELAAELTYPEPEGTTAGLLNASCQILAIAFISIYSALLHQALWANTTMCILLVVGTVLLFLTSSVQKRPSHQII